MTETDADRLGMIQGVGGEEFDTGYPEKLWGVFGNAFLAAEAGAHSAEVRRPVIECRTSDVALHGLVKRASITRDADGAQYVVDRFEPDGTGMTTIVLRQ